MIVKFTVAELAELKTYATRPFGQKNFNSFMSEICSRTDEDTGHVDMGLEDLQRIDDFRRKGHKKRIDKVFTRPVDDVLRRFFGES